MKLRKKNINKLISIVLSGFLFLVTTSCSDENDGDLSITVSPVNSFILPTNLIFSSDVCHGSTTYTAPRLKVPTFKTLWKGVNTFTPAILSITIKNSSNISDYQCLVTGVGNNLGVFLGYGQSTIEGGDIVEKESPCEIHCSTITVTNSSLSSKDTATVKLIGTTTVDGVETPVSATTTMTVENLGL